MKLYTWDLADLDLATLGGKLVVHCSNEYRCEVLRATSERVDLTCYPLGPMTLVRTGRALTFMDPNGRGSDRVAALTLEGAA